MTFVEASSYHRYHIETADAPDIVRWPSRFDVRVGKLGLAKLLLSEIIHTRGDLEVTTSRPCLYGVFSGPVGGFAPRPQYCVGCMRCTVQHPDFVTVRPNPARAALGDSYLTQHYIDTIAQEAQNGHVPVKGAGYRGGFGGAGFDGMWTDMSEIVRPTRDGIHGREFISTAIDIGEKPDFLRFDEAGQLLGEAPRMIQTQVPFLYDPPAAALRPEMAQALVRTAEAVDTLVMLPLEVLQSQALASPVIVPLVAPAAAAAMTDLPFTPRMILLDGWEAEAWAALQARWPQSLIGLRMPFAEADVLQARFDEGVRVFYLTADYHGQTPDGAYILDAIRAAHTAFVARGMRERVTLLGGGGLIAAEHVPKAILAGLDGVTLDIALLIAVQAHLTGEFAERAGRALAWPKKFSADWAFLRLRNLSAAWHDQLLEIMGAMGLREVRRLRGESGRAMFQKDLEREAFAGIEGYPVQEVA